jgi:MFS family permease
MRARAMSTLGGSTRIGVFVGPFLGAGAVSLWGIQGAYFVSLAVMAAVGVIVYRVPDLKLGEKQATANANVTTWSVLREHWRLFATLGVGVLLLSAIRQTRQSVIPLWAAHIGLPPTTGSLIYGVAGGVDVLTFYPAGKIMDLYGRRVVAVPSVLLMGASFMLMPLTHGAGTLMLVAMVMGFGNGMGSGLVMTLSADIAPATGRLTFFGIWRELSDAGSGIGPLILAAVTAVAGLGAGLGASGGLGLLAAAALWAWAPRGLGARARAQRAPPVHV